MADDTDFYTPFSLNETDMEYAMNPGQFRRQTKEQQVYGNFAVYSFVLFILSFRGIFIR